MGDVLASEPIHQAGIDFLASSGHRVHQVQSSADPAFSRHVSSCDALVVRQAAVDGDLLDTARRLKIVARYGAGFEEVDVRSATRRGVWVTNCPGANAQSVAEHVLGLMVTCARAGRLVDGAMRGGAGFGARELHRGIELKGKTLGLIGIGSIGRRVADMAQCAFGMRIIAFDPYVRQTPEPYIEIADRGEVFRAADVVSLHLPLTSASELSVGTQEFMAMKSEGIFLNTARGQVVDEPALIQALHSNLIAAAGIDVVSDASILDQLLACDRAVVTPHVAGLTEEADARVATMAAVDIDHVLNGRVPQHPVNSEFPW